MTQINGFLAIGIAVAVANTILMGFIAWQLWVARSRFDRFEFVLASFVGRIAREVRGVVHQGEWLVRQIWRAVGRVAMGK
jgi:hypothetical protein